LPEFEPSAGAGLQEPLNREDLPIAAFGGELLLPSDPGYDEARRVHNGMIDKRPALIARCRSTSDIAMAVGLARERGLEVSIRGGGHNVAGTAVTNGGVMVDLSPMRRVGVDESARIARCEGGTTWGEFDAATQRHGLAVTGGMISSTGVAGLTLGGGLGWLMGRHGLSADNLIAATVVTADGNVLRASAEENADLFWALRGGGGNFGVVSTFEFRVHPVGPVVTGGPALHRLADARELLRLYRDVTSKAPPDLTLNAGLIHAPDGSGEQIAGIVGCHAGALDEGERAFAPVVGFGRPVEMQIGPVEYTQLNSLLDAGYPRGALNYWKSSFLAELSDDAIDTMVELFSTCPSPTSSFVIENLHGAVTRVAPDATAVPHRTHGYNFLITSVWSDPAASEVNIAWTREVFEAMSPFAAPRRYVNYLADDEGTIARVREAYGPNYQRLSALKRVYDPDNVFRANQNIRPC
jgi:FAD/FMN-containing dehydrogenase